MHDILVVEHEPLVRAGLESLVNAQPGLRVDAAVGGRQEALSVLNARSVDLATVGLVPGGLETVAELHRRWPKMALVVVAQDNDPLLAERALRAGARVCLDRRQSTEDVVAALRQVLLGAEAASVSETSRLVAPRQNPPQLSLEALSDRELEVFRMVGEGLTTNRIAESLFISPKTVHTYRSRLREKLGIDSSDRLLLTAVRWVRAAERRRLNLSPHDRSALEVFTPGAVHCLASPVIEQRIVLQEGKDVVVGRGADADLCIPSATVSREHVRLCWEGHELTVTDVGSTNGTWLNGFLVHSPCRLRDRDRLDLGMIELWYFAQIPDRVLDADEKTRPMDR